jgi:hypothetical protein
MAFAVSFSYAVACVSLLGFFIFDQANHFWPLLSQSGAFGISFSEWAKAGVVFAHALSGMTTVNATIK